MRKTGYIFLLEIKNRKRFGSCSCSCSSSIDKHINWKYKSFYSYSQFKPFFAYITFVGGSTRRRLAGPRTGCIRRWQGPEVDLVGVPVILSGPGDGRTSNSRRRRASSGATTRPRWEKSQSSCASASIVAVGGAAQVEVKVVNELSSEEADKEGVYKIKSLITKVIINKWIVQWLGILALYGWFWFRSLGQYFFCKKNYPVWWVLWTFFQNL